MFLICLLFFFCPLQRKFILRRDDDRIKDNFIITWRSVGEHYCQTNCEPQGRLTSDEVPKIIDEDFQTKRYDEAGQPSCVWVMDVVGQP